MDVGVQIVLPVRDTEPVREILLITDLDTECTRLQDLDLVAGTQLKVLVTDVSTPTSFVVQPFGVELVEMSEKMMSLYDGNKSPLMSKEVVTPRPGDIYAAKFSQDDAWYRAKILSTPSSQGSHHVWVVYVDYGNEEEVPLSNLHPLSPELCTLPCQALLCSLGGVAPPAGQDWDQQTCLWISRLLLARPVEIFIEQSFGSNELLIDVLLSPQSLLSSDMLRFLPIQVSPQYILQLKQSLMPLSLASFLLSHALAISTSASQPLSMAKDSTSVVDADETQSILAELSGDSVLSDLCKPDESYRPCSFISSEPAIGSEQQTSQEYSVASQEQILSAPDSSGDRGEAVLGTSTNSCEDTPRDETTQSALNKSELGPDEILPHDHGFSSAQNSRLDVTVCPHGDETGLKLPLEIDTSDLLTQDIVSRLASETTTLTVDDETDRLSPSCEQIQSTEPQSHEAPLEVTEETKSHVEAHCLSTESVSVPEKLELLPTQLPLMDVGTQSSTQDEVLCNTSDLTMVSGAIQLEYQLPTHFAPEVLGANETTTLTVDDEADRLSPSCKQNLATEPRSHEAPLELTEETKSHVKAHCLLPECVLVPEKLELLPTQLPPLSVATQSSTQDEVLNDTSVASGEVHLEYQLSTHFASEVSGSLECKHANETTLTVNDDAGRLSPSCEQILATESRSHEAPLEVTEETKSHLITQSLLTESVLVPEKLELLLTQLPPLDIIMQSSTQHKVLSQEKSLCDEEGRLSHDDSQIETLIGPAQSQMESMPLQTCEDALQPACSVIEDPCLAELQSPKEGPSQALFHNMPPLIPLPPSLSHDQELIPSREFDTDILCSPCDSLHKIKVQPCMSLHAHSSNHVSQLHIQEGISELLTFEASVETFTAASEVLSGEPTEIFSMLGPSVSSENNHSGEPSLSPSPSPVPPLHSDELCDSESINPCKTESLQQFATCGHHDQQSPGGQMPTHDQPPCNMQELSQQCSSACPHNIPQDPLLLQESVSCNSPTVCEQKLSSQPDVSLPSDSVASQEPTYPYQQSLARQLDGIERVTSLKHHPQKCGESGIQVLPLPVEESNINKPSVLAMATSSHDERCTLLYHSWDSLQPQVMHLGKSSDLALLVSDIDTPGSFYAHCITAENAQDLVTLPAAMNDHYSLKSLGISLPATHLRVGGLCVLQFGDENMWFRAVITSLLSDTKCTVMFVDYGGSSTLVPIRLFYLDAKFCTFPIQCVHCRLANVCMPSPLVPGDESGRDTAPMDLLGSIDFHDVNSASSSCSWTESSVSAFREMVENKPLCAIVVGAGCEETLSQSLWHDALEVQLYDTSGAQDMLINDLLVKSGHAAHPPNEPIAPQLAAIESSTTQDIAAVSPNTERSLQVWNPMETDYLANRNNYEIDDEDPVQALHGYKSNKRVCRFFGTSKGCFRGSECSFLHLQPGVCDKKMEEAFVASESHLALPSVGEWVVVLMTTVITPNRFFIQLPCGLHSPFTLGSSSSGNAEKLDLLVAEMTDFFGRQVLSQRRSVPPHTGELVAARSEFDGQWYRARIRRVKEKSAQVYFVDYGNVEWVGEAELRGIGREFLQLPFQAVEACFSGVESTSASTEMKKKWRDLLRFLEDKLLLGRVMWRGWEGLLGLELYDPASNSGMSLNEELVKDGLLVAVRSPLQQRGLLVPPMPQKKSRQVVFLPG